MMTIPRPIRVEDRRGMLGEEVVDDIFESVSIDSNGANP